MKTNHELKEQLMQMKQTLQDLEAFNKAHLQHNIFDEIRSLRVKIMMDATNYFINMLEERREL